LSAVAVLLLITAVTVFVLVASGFFDPQPWGRPGARQPLPAVSVPARTTHLLWLPEPQLPPGNYTMQLAAAFESGEEDVAFGLVVGDEQHYLVTAVSPLGYLAVWERRHGVTRYHLPWQTWPHIRPGGEVNEIWIDRQDRRLTVRLNRELLWSGDVYLAGAEVGLFVQSFGEAAVIDFQTLQLHGGRESRMNIRFLRDSLLQLPGHPDVVQELGGAVDEGLVFGPVGPEAGSGRVW
jgi:hypothetical protein